MKLTYPALWYLYVLIIGISSLMIPFGLHREFYTMLRSFSLPEPLISGFTGLANLCWYEIAYLVGGGLKNVSLFNLIPSVGSATGLLSAVLLLLRVRIRRPVLLVHLGLSIMLGLLSLSVLGWRMVRHMEDPWRLVAAIAFFFFYIYWFFYFELTKRFFRVP